MLTVTANVFQTELGWMAFAGNRHGMTHLTFGHETEEAALIASESFPMAVLNDLPAWWEPAQSQLIAYAAGEQVDLSSIPVDLGPATEFQQLVRERVRGLGYGETASYGDIASDVGSPGAARAVGNIMARNPIPLVIPCHRVIGSGGRLGGFSAPSGLDMKRHLLAMEQRAESLF